MRVAAAQLDCTCGDIEQNTKKIIHYIGEAKKAGADMVLFPEIADTGYVLSKIASQAHTMEDDYFKSIAAAAKREEINVVCGVSERSGEHTYNTLAVLDREGVLIQKYRKTHLFHGEEHYYSAGKALATAEIDGVKFGLSVCFDLRFPELYRHLVLQGAEVFLNANAWPHKRGLHWDVLSQARAIENQAYYIGASHIGKAEELEFHGNSMVVSPSGEILARADERQETLLVSDINIQELRRYREHFKVLDLHRPELY